MANPYKGEVDFEVDGKKWTLAYSVNAIVELEDALGKSINEVAEILGDVKLVRIKTVRAVLWAGLTRRHPEIDIKGAGDLIDEMSLPVAVELIGRAFSLAFPEAAKGKNPPQPGGQKNGTGLGSTERGAASTETKNPSGDGPRVKSS